MQARHFGPRLATISTTATNMSTIHEVLTCTLKIKDVLQLKSNQDYVETP